MTLPVPPASRSMDRPHDHALELLALLEELAQFHDVDLDPEQSESLVNEGIGNMPPAERDPAGLLMQVGPELGLSFTPIHRTPREMVRDAVRLAPVVAESKEAPGGICLLTGKRGTSARVMLDGSAGHCAWLKGPELARVLGVADQDTPVRVLVCEPTLPLASAAAPGAHSHAHGHDHAHGTGHGKHHHPHGLLPPVTRLRNLMRLERNDLWVVAVYAVAVGVLALALPLAVQALVNNVSFATALQPVLVLALVVVIALGLAGFLRLMQLYVVENLQRRALMRAVADLSYRLPRVRLSAFDNIDGRKLVNRFYDVFTVQKSGSQLLLDGIAVFLELSVGLLVLAFYSPLLLGLSIFIWVSLGTIIFVMGRRAPATAVAESWSKHEAAGWLEEIVQHPSVFKSEHGRDFARSRADALARDYLNARSDHFKILVKQNIGAFSLQAIASAALLGVGGFLVIERQLTLGQLVASELILSGVIASLTKLGKQLEALYDLLGAMDKIGLLLDLPLEREGGEQLEDRGHPARVELYDLEFRYGPGAPKLHVPRLSLAPGEKLAVVGSGSAGKSTFLDLLIGLRDLKGGRIEVDGLDIRDVSLASLRNCVATVRGVEIFEGTIVENVRAGQPGVRLSDVRHALEAVGLLAEVSRLEGGLHTRLMPGGIPLSSGQAMRLMVAQALVRKPRILLLDKVLERIEMQHRARLTEVLFAKDAPWTLVVASDKEDVVRLCDKTLRLKDGHVDEVTAVTPAPKNDGGQR